MKNTKLNYCKSNFCKLTAIAMFLATCTLSCEKDLYPEYIATCNSGNCVDVNIKVSLILKPSGEGLSNIPVDIHFSEKWQVWFPEIKKVASGKTNKNGEFDINLKMNLEDFKKYILFVRIPEQKNYITIPSTKLGYSEISFISFEPEALKNIKFLFYKKANLTINLNKIQTNNDLVYLTVTHEFDKYNGSNIFHVTELEENIILHRETAADMYTKVLWQKRLVNGEQQFYSDSLICKQNSNNIFDINF